MKIDREEARRIAGLAHLEFDDDALDRMAAEMSSILGYIEMLPSVETTGGDASSTPLRDDAVAPSVDRDKVAANAPHWDGGFFIVPPVIE
jgi:aspartyl-tRNA(Asn)/glutamyl-tRNA(Gln) amidotransferase subunit C